MTTFKKILCLMLLLLAVEVVAQKKDDLNKEVQVTRAYDPILSDADKLDLVPTVQDSLLTIVGGYKYSIDQRDIVSNFALRPIQAARLRGQAYQDPKWLYARLGLGYPLQPVVDLYANNLQPDNLNLGMFYNHRSIWTNINNGSDIPIDEMHNQGAIFVRKYFDAFSVGVQAGAKQQSLLFYGYDTQVDLFQSKPYKFNKDSLHQNYINYFADIDLESKSGKVEALRYKIGFNFQHFGDNGANRFTQDRMFAMGETALKGSLLLSKAFSEGQHTVGIEIDGQLLSRKLDFNKKYNTYPEINRGKFGEVYQRLYGNGIGIDTSNSRLYLNVFPSYSLHLDLLNLKIGLKVTGYKLHTKMQAKVYPMLDLNYKVSQAFIPFVQLEGALESNSYANMVQLNPYILPGLAFDMRPTDRNFELKMGSRGKVENYLSYQVYGQYILYKDRFFFVNSGQSILDGTGQSIYSLGNNFTALYDDTQELSLGADVQVKYSLFDSKLGVAYHKYMLDQLATAYHKPQIVLNWNNEISLANGLKLNLNLNFESKRSYLHTGVTSLQLPEIFTVGLGGEYLLNRNFSIFIQLENITNQKYQQWYQYMRPGISAIGGITFKL